MARATESWINDTIPRERYSAVCYIYAIPYPYPMWQCKSKRKKTKNRKKKEYSVEEASLNARRIALRDGIARRRPFAITGRDSFFARSGSRTPLIAFDNFIRHDSPYVHTILHRWRISFCHDLSLIRVYSDTWTSIPTTRETRARNQRNELSPRTANCRAKLAETDRNSNVQIARNYFPRRTMRHVGGVHELCAQTKINQEDGMGVS